MPTSTSAGASHCCLHPHPARRRASADTINVAEFRWEHSFRGTECTARRSSASPTDPDDQSTLQPDGPLGLCLARRTDAGGCCTFDGSLDIPWLEITHGAGGFDQFARRAALPLSAATTIFFDFLGETLSLSARSSPHPASPSSASTTNRRRRRPTRCPNPARSGSSASGCPRFARSLLRRAPPRIHSPRLTVTRRPSSRRAAATKDGRIPETSLVDRGARLLVDWLCCSDCAASRLRPRRGRAHCRRAARRVGRRQRPDHRHRVRPGGLEQHRHAHAAGRRRRQPRRRNHRRRSTPPRGSAASASRSRRACPSARQPSLVRNRTTNESAGGRTLQIIRSRCPQTTSAARGAQQLAVRIDGSSNVQFVAGRTTPTFGAGITVTSTQVLSPTSLVATVSVSPTDRARPARRSHRHEHADSTACGRLHRHRAESATGHHVDCRHDARRRRKPYTYQVVATDPDGDHRHLSSRHVPRRHDDRRRPHLVDTERHAGRRTQRRRRSHGRPRRHSVSSRSRSRSADAPQLQAIDVQPSLLRFSQVDTTRPLTVTGLRTNGTTVDLTSAASGTIYESSNAFVARVAAGRHRHRRRQRLGHDHRTQRRTERHDAPSSSKPA